MTLKRNLLKLVIPAFSALTLYMTMSRSQEIRNGEPMVILSLLLLAVGKSATVFAVLMWEEDDRRPAITILAGGAVMLVTSLLIWDFSAPREGFYLAGL